MEASPYLLNAYQVIRATSALENLPSDIVYPQILLFPYCRVFILALSSLAVNGVVSRCDKKKVYDVAVSENPEITIPREPKNGREPS